MRKLSPAGLVLLLALPVGAVRFAGLQQAHPGESAANSTQQYLSVKFENVKWQKMFPDWGVVSPEIAILHVDPKTQATQLLIRTPKRMYVSRHWHTANETHTILAGTWAFECDGKREELSQGSFNYIPSKKVHQAWAPDDGVLFITVDSGWDINWVDGPPQRPAQR
jgi:quercetin dioxygenase-like cupin family protein